MLDRIWESISTSSKEVTTTNAQTGKTSVSLVKSKNLKKITLIAGGAAAAVGAMIGTYPWAEWSQGEAREILGFSAQKAINTGDEQTILDFQEAQAEIVDQSKWEQIARLIPGTNIAVGFWNKARATAAQAKVNDKLMDDALIQLRTGESEDDKWTRVKEEEAQADRDSVDYYNDERRKLVDWEREADVNNRNDDAAFWKKERAKQDAAEKEERENQAAFWLEYRKAAQKLSEDTRPSNLNFGLL